MRPPPAISSEEVIFRVKPRLLRLLGEQLIRDASLAVFELVKNAYDADATECRVMLSDIESPERACVIVEDDGVGMRANTIRDVWMVIATDFRANQRDRRQRTPQFHRFPLGEKGLGRLAAHKLGRHITVVTRQCGEAEVMVELDWDKLESAPELDKAGISLKTREPEVFVGRAHGTRVVVRGLRESWTCAKVRALHRAVSSLCSPFKGPGHFDVSLMLDPPNDWLEGLLNPGEVRQCALYHARGWFEGDQIVYDYAFRPPRVARANLHARMEKGLKHPLQKKDGRRWVAMDLTAHGIGRVEFDFYVFDREPSVLRAVTEDVRGLCDYLDANGGIRIYREGMRVFDFGEPGTDWLNLDARRVNTPVIRVSNNQVLGSLLLDGPTSTDLVEKTNREGFLENTAYEDFRDAVVSVLTQIEAEKQGDQKVVRQFFSRRGPQRPILDEIGELRELLERRGVLAEVAPKLARVEKQLQAYQETMLRAAVPGLTFGALIHGAEKILKELVQVVRTGGDMARIRKLVEQLDQMVGRLGNLLRRSGTQNEKAGALIEQALFNVDFRLRAHGIAAVNGVVLGSPDFSVQCTRRLIVGSLTNLLDNSIYWLQFAKGRKPQVFLGTSHDVPGGPAIVVADNGPGFQDEPDVLVQPFFSRRPDGMGLGLYLADEVMRLHGGRLLFPQRGDVPLPREFTGAIVALQFMRRT